MLSFALMVAVDKALVGATPAVSRAEVSDAGVIRTPAKSPLTTPDVPRRVTADNPTLRVAPDSGTNAGVRVNGTTTARTVTGPRLDIPASLTDGGQVVTALLARNRGVVIGEDHNEDNIEPFLARHMPAFYGAGVRRMFVEAVDARDQAVLDAFNRREAGSEERLQATLTAKWNSPYRYDAMLAARNAGIAITAIDTERRPPEGSSISADDPRYDMAGLNDSWRRTAEAALRPGEKFLMLGGVHHTHRKDGDGVDQMMGVPALGPRDPNRLRHNLPVLGLGRDMVITNRGADADSNFDYRFTEPASERAALVARWLGEDGNTRGAALATTMSTAFAELAKNPSDSRARARATAAYRDLQTTTEDAQIRQNLDLFAPLLRTP